MTTHPAIAPGKVAVVTGGASGIGLAAARRLAAAGMTVVIADLPGETLEAVAAEFHVAATDVSRFEAVEALAAQAGALGEVSVLMNNAGMGRGAPTSWEGMAEWRTLVDTNFWGVVHGVQAFAPGMIARGAPAAIVNTGSKQGITLPPGGPAYNLSKAAVRAYTETLAHELRGVADGAVSAHLLIPGFTWTGMTARGRDMPPAAWTPDQVAAFMLASLARGDFYILCPDNDVSRETDEKRVQWMADDLIKNRPALSRWHPDFQAAFADFMRS